tara:strand:- start:36 stop:278 length:243 start_codon:yes stop_codon:yes gene_type:complete
MFENGYYLIKSKRKDNDIIADCYDEMWSLPEFKDRVSTEKMLKKYEVSERIINKPRTAKFKLRTEENANLKYQGHEYKVL